MPIAWRLYLPEVWAHDKKRRKATGIPPEIRFQTKPEIALQQIRTALDREIPTAPVLADAAYGNDTGFRDGITELGLLYVVGIQSSVSVWKPGQAPLPKRKWKGIGRPTKLLRRDGQHNPLAVRELAMSLPASAWKTVRWREGTRKPLRSRFAALRLRPAHRDYGSSEPRPRGVAADRVAESGSRTDQVLVIDSARPHPACRSGALGQAALDHRA